MDERDERRVEVEREPIVERQTTIVTGGGERGGGGGTLLAVVLLVVVVVALFLLFGRNMISGAADEVDIKVDVEAPDIDLPKADPPATPQPSN